MIVLTRNRFWETFHRHIFPFLPPLVAIASIIIQQIYYPAIESTISINILLLVVNLVEFFPFLYRSTNRILHLIGVALIIILAFIFNIQVGGVSSPLSNFKAFMDSICGLWVVLLILEVLSLQFAYLAHNTSPDPSRPRGDNDETLISPGSSRNTDERPMEYVLGSETSVGTNEANGPLRENTPSANNRDRTQTTSDIISKSKANLFLVVFAIIAILLPFASWASFEQSSWMQSVRAITKFIFGNAVDKNNVAVVLLLYLLGLFVIAIAVIVGITIVRYVLARYLSHNSSQEDFFEEYSTPIIILVVAGALVLAIRSSSVAASTTSSTDSLESSWHGMSLVLGYITSLFAYMLCIIVAIIALLVAFETIRLVLKQCMKRGSLLKGSMQLIFALIVQYAMGLLTGILRIFALKDVIESLLLFFLPDLEQSIEPDVKQVLDTALKREVKQIAEDMGIAQPFWKHQRQRRSGCRIVRKRRRRK